MRERLADEEIDRLMEIAQGTGLDGSNSITVLNELLALRADNERAYSYAVNFLQAFIKNNNQSPVNPLPSLSGVLTQIDNATTITCALRAENGRLLEDLKGCRLRCGELNASNIDLREALPALWGQYDDEGRKLWVDPITSLRAENERLLDALNEALRADPVMGEVRSLRAENERLRAGGEPNAYEARMNAYGKKIDELTAENERLRRELKPLCYEYAYNEMVRLIRASFASGTEEKAK